MIQLGCNVLAAKRKKSIDYYLTPEKVHKEEYICVESMGLLTISNDAIEIEQGQSNSIGREEVIITSI